MSPPVLPPSAQEIHRKLSVHPVPISSKTSSAAFESTVSGTESDSDSMILGTSLPSSTPNAGQGTLPHPLSSIAERQLGSGEDSDEEEEEGGWRSAGIKEVTRDSIDEGVIKSGYLWKKGKRRKSWKKRWFVLRSAHLAYYKTSAEYQLLRLLQLSDVHSCTPVTLKKHGNTFGLISPVRTYYLQAKTSEEVQEWVQAIEETRASFKATLTQTALSSPIPIPTTAQRSPSHPPSSISPPITHMPLHNFTSSDSEDASPINQITYSSPQDPTIPSTPKKSSALVCSDSGKVILSGYLMKCGSKRRNWRKRWFTLTGEKLAYSGSHMDTKPHKQFLFSQILDALEYNLPSRHNAVLISTSASAGLHSTSPSSDVDDPYATHTFKIVTTKRTLLLCAPTEEDEIKWLGAIRALIARRSTMTGDPVSKPHGAPPPGFESGTAVVSTVGIS